MPVETSPAGRTPSDCPQGWREVPLGSVTDVRFSSVDKLTYGSEEPIRLCNYIEVYQNDYITADLEFMRASATHAEIDRLGLQVGDVIITKDSEAPDDIGVPAVVDYAAPDLVCGYHLGLLRPKQTQVDPTFLSKQLGHHRLAHYFGRQANGLTRYGLPISAVTNAPIWLPHLTEQKTIGLLLRLVDEAIATTEAVIAKLKQVHSGLLHDLLTRGLDADGQLRDPIAHPEQFKDSPLGTIPREWRICGVLDVAPPERQGILTGPFGAQLGQRDFVREGVPVLRIGNVQAGYIDWSDMQYVSPSKAVELTRFSVASGDLLFARQGATTGRNALADTRAVGALINYHIIRVAVDRHLCEPVFLHALFNSESARRQINRDKGRGTREGINTDQIASLRFALPSIGEQRRAVAVLAEHAATESAESTALAKLNQFKCGLMADLLTGRVRVPENLEIG